MGRLLRPVPPMLTSSQMRRREMLVRTGRFAAGALLLPFAAIAQSGRRSAPRLKTLVARWEQQVPALMKETTVPGVSMAVVVDGKLRWRRGFGVSDALSANPVGNETIFEAASMSKPVFAYLVMKLAEKGVLDLDAPLAEYTPKRFFTGDSRLDVITARHVLSHTTGFPNWRSAEEPMGIRFTPGGGYGYSGEGYYYLQSVLTHLTGHEDLGTCHGGYEGDLEVCATDIAAYIKANVLAPFRMQSSSYAPIKAIAQRMARGHDRKGAPKVRGDWKATDPARYAAAGGLLTTPTDYAKFLIEVINPRPADAHRLARKSLDEMLRPQIPVTSNDEIAISWALGWRVARTPHGELISHGGDNPGFHCLAEVSRTRKSGFVIMTNGDGGVEFLQKFAPDMSNDLHSLPAIMAETDPEVLRQNPLAHVQAQLQSHRERYRNRESQNPAEDG